MLSERLRHWTSRRGAIEIGAAIVFAAILTAWHLSETVPLPAHGKAEGDAATTFSSGSPWTYSPRADARFTIALYADLECPYCKAYLPVLKTWIDRHPQAALQWRHLPLVFHEPAATELAVMAECAGTVSGPDAFWDSVTWIFRHTKGEGRGLPGGTTLPGMTPALRKCLDGGAAIEAVRAQARQATQEGIDATPTLKLSDAWTGKEMVLSGAVEGDALLSALDLLAARDDIGTPSPTELPADVVGKPR
ncbi:DSBA oxidoreductase [Brucella anthropi]|uniref:DsbA family protein n=1 Tax=Brucella anthropi TaxID=529 RepID=UPI0004519290|nr:thioredoxin domain-containing protein [Brucella anthropi]EXL06531.1 DSBA oxidoreductase [Brucella anthropi]